MELTIFGIEDAVEALSLPHGFTHVVSIVAPDDGIRPTIKAVRRAVVLEFHDVTNVTAARTCGYRPPEDADIERLVRFARDIPADAEDVHLLVHCHAGISRSTAAAFIVLATIMGPGQEREAFLGMLGAQPAAWPNTLMVEIADRLLGRGGALANELRLYRLRKNGMPYRSGYQT